MFRKQVSPRVAALAIVLILAAVQFFYWRLLVYRPTVRAPMGGGGGGMPPGPQVSVGLDSVQVELFAGGDPGYVDGPAWRSRFCGPNALALERDGSLLVADSRNHRIRRVTRAGVVSTV